MKRLPILFSLLAMIALSASAAYWGLQLYTPQQRPLAAAPAAQAPEPAIDAAGGLFGGQAAAAVVTSYQLTGVVSAGRDSVAILTAEGQPAKALKVGKEIVAGVSVAEVHPRYVMLSEGGILKRIDLVPDAKAGASLSPPPGQGQGAPQGGQPGTPGQMVPPPPAPIPQMPSPSRVVAPGSATE